MLILVWEAVEGVEREEVVISMTALECYFESFRKIVSEYPEPECWGLLATAEDRMRGEHMARIRRKLGEEKKDASWPAVFIAAAGDDRYWDEQVRRPANKHIANGSRGKVRTPDHDDVNNLKRALGVGDQSSPQTGRCSANPDAEREMPTNA